MKTKKLFNNIFAAGLLSVAFGLHAVEPINQTIQEKSEPKIVLYDSELGKKVIQQLPINSHLIKIYQKNDWIKVGDAKDGLIGWINKTEYQKALDEFNQPNIQEIFVSQSVDKNNKPEIKIVAYKNGKPVSEKEAGALYEKIKNDRKAQEEYWKKWNQQMLYVQKTMRPIFSDNLFFSQPFLHPIFIMN